MTSQGIPASWREQNKRGECIHSVSIVRPCELCYGEGVEIEMRHRDEVEPGTQLNLGLLIPMKGGVAKAK